MQQWYRWMHEMKKKDEEKRKEEEHQQLVSRKIVGAEGSGLLHKITQPTALIGGVQVLKEEEKDVRPLARCEEKRKERAKHWQCDTR